MKTITGKVNFAFLMNDIHDFYRDMDRNNVEVVSSTRNLFSYTFTVRGTNSDLKHARWYFTHGKMQKQL